MHSAGGKTNCTKCLDICPTGAVTSVDGAIAVDAAICAGCGSCVSVCPTGAMTYIAPATTHTRRRLAVLIGGYLAAGGRRPVLLIHSTEMGEQAVSALARLGTGLPANVLPMALRRPTSVGLDLLVLALSLGALKVVIQVDPEHAVEMAALERQAAFANDLIARLQGSSGRIAVLQSADPEEMGAAVVDDAALPAVTAAHMPDGDATEASLVRDFFGRLAAAASPAVEEIKLAPGAAYGRVAVSDACTLCLACTRSCPTGALAGDVRTSSLGFIEESCVQCGLCASVCPERAITLEPRMSFSKQAAVPTVLKRDEPAICTGCGTRYGSRRTVDGVIARLGVSGWTGQNGQLIERLRLCESCRVTVQ
ncbi:MAG: 4Fe-4S binding protein [Hyphomicrobium sp.]